MLNEMIEPKVCIVIPIIHLQRSIMMLPFAGREAWALDAI